MKAAAGHESLSWVIITDKRLLPKTLVLLATNALLYSLLHLPPIRMGLES